MLLLLCVVVVLANLHSGVAQTVVNGPTLAKAALFAGNNAVLTINADDAYSFYWNGQFLEGKGDTPSFNLVPVPICNFPNVLAIKATDYGGFAGVIMQLEYAGVTYKMGTSPEIKLTDEYTDDPAWYLTPYADPAVWASSNTVESCGTNDYLEAIRRNYFQEGTYWRWFRNCNQERKSIFVKLVVYTKQSSCCH